MEDAVLHGCIPVIVQVGRLAPCTLAPYTPRRAPCTLRRASPTPLDMITSRPAQDGVHTPWEAALDAPSYSIRVPRASLPSLVTHLRALPAERVAALQAGLRRVWPRFTYLGNVVAEMTRRHEPPAGPRGRTIAAAARNDATATLLQLLRARLRLRHARRRALAGEAPAASAGCVADAAGGDISPEDHAAERGFEGRTVNGWVI